ncbi:MAG: succinylglutamate desuccinylase/aspartoacylase family protein [Pseudomonadota bacterium]
MARDTQRFAISHSAPGTQREVIVHSYNKGHGGKIAYLQGALHADETPALLVLHHLTQLLDEADAKGQVLGEIRLVPYANPIGLSQFLNGHHMGRYELSKGENFNRGWPNLSYGLVGRMRGQLGDNEAANVVTIRAALRDAVSGLPVHSELQSLQKILASQAVEADYVWDLHCDNESLMHIYLIPSLWPKGADLAAELACYAVLLAADSGGGPFDECFTTPWTKLQGAYPDHPIPTACFGTTIELRGQADVSDDLARQDARALFRSLQREGLVEGDPGPSPEPKCEATDLTGCQIVHAPASGIVAYEVGVGDQLKKGQTIAWIVDPSHDQPQEGRHEVISQTDGLLLARSDRRYVAAGESLGKVVGREALEGREMGSLLEP